MFCCSNTGTYGRRQHLTTSFCYIYLGSLASASFENSANSELPQFDEQFLGPNQNLPTTKTCRLNRRPRRPRRPRRVNTGLFCHLESSQKVAKSVFWGKHKA